MNAACRRELKEKMMKELSAKKRPAATALEAEIAAETEPAVGSAGAVNISVASHERPEHRGATTASSSSRRTCDAVHDKASPSHRRAANRVEVEGRAWVEPAREPRPASESKSPGAAVASDAAAPTSEPGSSEETLELERELAKSAES